MMLKHLQMGQQNVIIAKSGTIMVSISVFNVIF